METFLTYALAAILVLGLLIFVHELGHFLVAKLSGVSVLRFSLGFGPRLVGRKIGETEYMVSLVPLGGYVKMLGEDDSEDGAEIGDPARSFANQSLPKRFSIVLAGPLSNLTFSWVCLIVLLIGWGAMVPSDEPLVGGLSHGLPAERAGLAVKDRILAVDGDAVSSWDDLSAKILRSEGRALTLRVERAGSSRELSVTPERQVNRSLFGEDLGEVYRIGIERAAETESVAAWKAPGLAARQVVLYSELIVMSLVKMVQGKISAREIGGPITIARVAGERAQGGLKGLLEFMAFLGVNLGVLNLLPIPVLDGGHLMFFATEAVIRRPLKVKYRELAQQIGLFLLVSLMLFAVYNDIYRWIQG